MKAKKLFMCNLILFILELFANAWMMSGIVIGEAALTAESFRMFRYFTVDSNVFMGAVALLAALWELQIAKGKREALPMVIRLLQLMAVSGVTLTLLVTVFFLAPTSGGSFWHLFTNANFFLHLVNPLLSIYILVGLEKTDRISFRQTLWGILPMALYAFYYVVNILLHTENGQVSYAYDWYGFLFMGLSSLPVVVVIFFVGTWGITLLLWTLGKVTVKKA